MKDDVRQSLYDACDEWVKTVRQGKQPFLGGAQPNLGDLVSYLMKYSNLGMKTKIKCTEIEHSLSKCLVKLLAALCCLKWSNVAFLKEKN